MVVLSQVIKVLRSRNLLAFMIFEAIGTLLSEVGYLLGSFSIQAELFVYWVLGVSNNFPEDEVLTKNSMLDLLVVSLG